MTFSRLIVSAAGIATAVAFAPAFAQQHEVGHWSSAPGAPSAAVQAMFSFGVLSAPATPLDDPRLQTPNATQEARETHYYDITLKNANVAAGGDRDMTLKGQNILQNAREIRPVAGVGSSASTTWVRTAQPHTTTSVMPTHRGWGPWEVQLGSAPKTAPPAAGVRQGPMPGGHGAPIRR
jgi:cell division septation protein DedD